MLQFHKLFHLVVSDDAELHRCQSLSQKMWFDSKQVVRQLSGIGAKFTKILVEKEVVSWEAFEEMDARQLEMVRINKEHSSLLTLDARQFCKKPSGWGSDKKREAAKIWPKCRISTAVTTLHHIDNIKE